MEKSKTLTLGLKRLICLVITLLMIASVFGFVSPTEHKASAAEQFTEYPPTSLSLSNGHFNTSSSSFPATVTSWSGNYKGGLTGDFIISGVIDLSSKYSEYADKIELNKYPEYKNGAIPQTPFGKSNTENGKTPYFEGSSSSALLINTSNHETVYGYTSPTITLEANGFYKISAWVKTGDFSQTSDKADAGASIALNGFNEPVAFTSINTVKDLKEENTEPTPDNFYGWKEYVFYIATDFHSYTVSIDLSVGYAYEDEEGKILELAKGYALFDTVTAYSISPEMFASAQDNKNVIIKKFDKSSYLTDNNGKDIGSFDIFTDNHKIQGWSQITTLNGEELSPQNSESPFIYKPYNFSTNNNIGLETNPATPFGLNKDNNILMFYNKDSEIKGLQSSSFTVNQNKFYKVSFWTNTANLDGDSSVSASLIYMNPKDPENEVINTISSIKGNSENAKNYGWAYNAFFIKGSYSRDYEVALQLWFGRDDTRAKGIAMFDEIKMEIIDAETYSDYAPNYTSVDLTSDYTDESGITNGNFMASEPSDNATYPLEPTGWIATSDDNDDVTAGLLPKDDATVWSGLNLKYPFSELFPHKNYGNALVISSENPVYYGYTSAEISLAQNQTTLITVRLRTYNNARATVSIKNSDAVIAKIANAVSNKEFTDYKIYLKNNDSAHTVSLEIALGQAKDKSFGTVVVEYSKLETIEEFDYDEYREKVISDKTLAVYDYEDLFACDMSDYANEPLMEAYHWTASKGDHNAANVQNVKYGILYLKDSRNTYLPSNFDKGIAPKDYIFYAQNIKPNASVFTYEKSIALNANTHYEIRITAKVQIPDWYLEENPEAVGLGIRLDDTNYSFANIKQTRSKDEDSEFKTYSFYIAVGAENAPSTKVSLTLGGSENRNQFIQGELFVNNITISEITESTYTNAIENAVEYNDENADNTEFGMKVDLSEADDEEPDTNDAPVVDENLNSENLYWYILPSVLFGVFLLLALVAVVVRKFNDKISNRKHKEKANSYDRDYTLHMDVDNKDASAKTKKTIDKYESFDEDAPLSELNTSEPTTDDTVASEETDLQSDNNEEPESAEVPEEKAEEPIEEPESSNENKANSVEDFND